MRPILAVLIALVLLPVAAPAEQRLALVIGNDAYGEVPELRKAVSDAEAVAQALDGQGFEVILATDAPRREMNRRIAEFTGRLQRGDTAFVFFAGHGVEIDGENYLLPTDIIAPAAGEKDFIKSESIALSSLLDRVRATGARTTLAVIDACRDNPFAVSTGRSIGRTRGLGRITAPEGTFVIFSAGAGQLALDELRLGDPDPNSVFTRKLLPKLKTRGLELRTLMSELRVEVRDLALTQGHQQFPAYYDELLGEFYFAAAAPAPAGLAKQDPAPKPESDIRSDFELALQVGTPAALQAFLDAYGDESDDFTVGLARSLLAEQTAESAAPAPKDGERALVVTPDAPAEDAPAPETAAAPEAAPPDRRTLTRQLQAELNRVGCKAGTPDGVAGPRTRAAFAAFAEARGLGMNRDDIGTEAALAAARAATGTVCAEPTGPTGIDMSGRWTYRATCAIVVSATGVINYRWLGGNRFRGRNTNSLGQTATTDVVVDGQTLRGTDRLDGGGVGHWTATVSADGRSYSGSGSVGCVFKAQRG